MFGYLYPWPIQPLKLLLEREVEGPSIIIFNGGWTDWTESNGWWGSRPTTTCERPGQTPHKGLKIEWKKTAYVCEFQHTYI
jgi:hypothetical protein